jgi:lipid-binding SYLF domain-containing protein
MKSNTLFIKLGCKICEIRQFVDMAFALLMLSALRVLWYCCLRTVKLSGADVQALKSQYLTQGGQMKRVLAVMASICLTLPLMAQEKEQQRIKDSAQVLSEILATPDKGIPQDLLDKADCVIVFPSVKKGAFIVGGSYGRGVVTCRSGVNFSGPWSAPAMFALEGASIGFQIGGQATDFVILVMNEGGANSIMSSKVKLGADASVAAGPVGRNTSAETDIVLKAQMLSWSRARGVFAGISLAGSTLRSDDGANKNLYGRDLTAKEIVREGKVKPPAAARRLQGILSKASPHHKA